MLNPHDPKQTLLIMDDEDAFRADHQSHAHEGRDGEVLLAQCCADLAVTEARALEFIAWADEHLPARRMEQVGAGFTPLQHAVMLEKFFRFFIEDSENLWLEIRAYAWLLNIPALDDMLNHTCPADWARQCDGTRANAIKSVAKIQMAFNLPPRKGQKDGQARRKMSARRNSQLKNGARSIAPPVKRLNKV